MIGSSNTWTNPTVEHNRRPARTPLATAALVAAVLLVFYALPTLLEWEFALSPLGLIAVGDALGCAALAAFNWRRGIALYVVLSALEYAGLNFGFVSMFDLMLLTDAVPAAYLTAGAIRFLGCVPDLN